MLGVRVEKKNDGAPIWCPVNFDFRSVWTIVTQLLVLICFHKKNCLSHSLIVLRIPFTAVYSEFSFFDDGVDMVWNEMLINEHISDHSL